MRTKGFRIVGFVAVLSTIVFSTPVRAGTLPASAGFADNSGQMSCFQRDWQNPGRVSYTCASPSSAWWDMPVPTTTTGNHFYKVYISTSSSTECDAFQLYSDGSIRNWTSKTIAGGTTGWQTFTLLGAASDDTAEITCQLSTTSGGATNYVSAVGGF